MMLRTSLLMVCTVTLAVLMGLGAAHAQPAIGTTAARAGCTNASLQGTYGFTARGTTLDGSPVPPDLQGPFAGSGLAVFDGQGHVTLTATNSFNGVIQSITVQDTYQVNPDCTYTSQADDGVTFYAVIMRQGQEVFILQTTPGVVIAGVARQQTGARPKVDAGQATVKPFTCGNGTVQGTYGFLAEGTAGPPMVPAELAGPLSGVGTVRFETNGTFLLTAIRSVNGVLDPEPLMLPGTYAVTQDCQFRMVFEVGFTFTVTIVNSGQDILFIETDPGTTLLVQATRL
jgi:hypothetical protein